MNEPFPAERVFDLAGGVLSTTVLGQGVLLWSAGGRTAEQDVLVIAHRAGWLACRRVQTAADLVGVALAAAVSGEPVAGVTLHGGGHVGPAWLALRFALHLASHRRQHDPNPVAPCVTASQKPDLPAAHSVLPLVRLPHLLTVRTAEDELVDTVVWEIMTSVQAQRWLGREMPDQAFFESRLPALLRLRSEVRGRRYPLTPEGRQLNTLLTGRYLSLRLVYRHPALFQALLIPSNAAEDLDDQTDR